MAVKRKTSSRATGTRVRAKRGKAAAVKSSALTRAAKTLGAAVGRTERAARNLGRTTGETKAALGRKISILRSDLHRLERRKARAHPAFESRLTKFAVAVGTALGRTERVARQAGQGALETKDALEGKIAALSNRLARARTELKRAAVRTGR